MDWLEGFQTAPMFTVTAANLFSGTGRNQFTAALGEADIVVLLHSCLMDSLDYVRAITAPLKDRRVKLVAFVGNEYNNPWAPISQKIAWLQEVGADLVVTQLVQESGDWLYQQVGGRVLSLPHALNPNAFPMGPDTASRKRHIGTLSHAYPLFLGENLRQRAFDRVRSGATARGWSVEISTSRRLGRQQWAAFLRQSQCTLATEAGAALVDRSDQLAFDIQDFLTAHRGNRIYRPNSRFRALTRRVPWPAKEAIYRVVSRFGLRHESLEFDDDIFNEVLRRFFAGRQHAGVTGKCISARHMDAAGSGTVQILTDGFYNGILRPGEHYIALRADMSNLDAVLDQAEDPILRRHIADAAYTLAMEHHTISHRLERLAGALP